MSAQPQRPCGRQNWKILKPRKTCRQRRQSDQWTCKEHAHGPTGLTAGDVAGIAVVAALLVLIGAVYIYVSRSKRRPTSSLATPLLTDGSKDLEMNALGTSAQYSATGYPLNTTAENEVLHNHAGSNVSTGFSHSSRSTAAYDTLVEEAFGTTLRRYKLDE